MVKFFVIGLLSFVISGFFLLILGRLANKVGLLDHPSDRKLHNVPTPLVGGLGIFCCLVIVAVATTVPDKVKLMLLVGGFVLVLGLLDDMFNLSALFRLVAQVGLAGFMVVHAELQIEKIAIFSIDINLGKVAGGVLAIIFLVLMINAFNLIDGIDGLASGLAIVAIVLLIGSQNLVSSVSYPYLFSALIGGLLCFWLVNISFMGVSRVFLGDAGSLFLGYIISWLIIDFSVSGYTTISFIMGLWATFIPILDVTQIIAMRIKHGKKIWHSDRMHIHHLLVDSGISDGKALGILMASGLFFGSLGILLSYVIGSDASAIFFITLLLGLILLINAYHDKRDRRFSQ